MRSSEPSTDEPKQVEMGVEGNQNPNFDAVPALPERPSLRAKVTRYTDSARSACSFSAFTLVLPAFSSLNLQILIPRSVKGFFFPVDPPPPKANVDDADYTPEMTASFLSNLTFAWLTPLMALGYARPLEAPDLWKLQDHRSSSVISDKILRSFEARKLEADAHNSRLASGDIKPASGRRLWWRVSGNMEKERKWLGAQKKRPSLSRAINDSIKAWFWWGGIFKVIGDMAEILSPLLIKVRCATRAFL